MLQRREANLSTSPDSLWRDVSPGLWLGEKLPQKKEVKSILSRPVCFIRRRRCGEAKGIGTSLTSTMMVSDCASAYAIPPAKEQINHNLIGDTNHNISFEVTFPQFTYRLVREDLKGLAYRRLIVGRGIDKQIDVLSAAHETRLNHRHPTDHDVLRAPRVELTAKRQKIF